MGIGMDKDAGGHERERIMKGWMISGLLLLALSLMASAHATNKLTLILTNAQGTVVAEKVPYGAVTYTAAYRPYGKQQVGAPQQGPGYTGHVNDSDTGLVYMQARYYDPGVGRFLSIDPSGPVAGSVFNFNRYDYANNNPVKFMDLNGQESVVVESKKRIDRFERDANNFPGVDTAINFLGKGEWSVAAIWGGGFHASGKTDGTDNSAGIVLVGEGLEVAVDGKLHMLSIPLPAAARKIPFSISSEYSVHALYGGKLVVIFNKDGKVWVGVAGGRGLGESVQYLSLDYHFKDANSGGDNSKSEGRDSHSSANELERRHAMEYYYNHILLSGPCKDYRCNKK